MKKTLIGIIALSGLALTLIPSILVFTGALSAQTNKVLMAAGTFLWFTAAPFWIRRPQ